MAADGLALHKSATNLLLRTAWIACAVYATVIHSSAGLAQTVAPITSSGLGTEVNLSPTPPTGAIQHDITGGTRAGTNLFHSFGAFNVPNGAIANFLNDTGLSTTNILGRVTGGQPSTIFGTIQTSGFGQANLFLMNPSGIVFGPTASLHVGGSIAFTTADYLRFADNGRFMAIPNAATDAILSSVPVAAYGFLDSNTGPIRVQGGGLTVQERQGLSLIGGNITIESGTLTTDGDRPAPVTSSSNRINLAGVGSPGEVLAGTFDYAPNIHGQSFESLGTIQVVEKSVIDTSGNGGGTVLIRGGQFVLDDSKISANVTNPGTIVDGVESVGGGIDIAVSQDATIQKGAAVEANVASGTTPGVTYGGVHVKADRIVFLGIPGSAADFTTLRFTGITTNTEGAGNAGNITLRATGNIELTHVVSLASTSGFNADGTQPSSTLAQGNAGNVELTSAQGNILMTTGGRATQVTSQLLNSAGNTGRVTASAPEGDIVLDGAGLLTVSFHGRGRVGPVEITAKNLWMHAGQLSNENTADSLFKPGGITVTLSGTLTMAADFSHPSPIPPNSLITTSAFSPTTDTPAGDITITAKDIVATQGSLISSETYRSGPGGQLRIFTDTLQLRDGSRIASGSTFAPLFGRLPQGNTPTGPGGDLTIRSVGSTGSVLIDGAGSGIFADTEGAGAGGTIDLSARSLTIQSGGTVSASSTGSGDAGNILIDAGQQLELTNGSSITTSTQSSRANGGNIDIRAIDRVRLVDSTISTSVQGAEGSGGNIFIDPKVVVLQGSNVIAQAVGGSGGNITFVTPLFLSDPASLVSASSQRGPSGTVTIQSPISNLSGTVGQLVSKTAPPQVLLQNQCVASAGGQSTFIVAGRDALPAEPGGWLSSPVSMGHWTEEETEEHASGLMVRSIRLNQLPAMIASKDESQILSLRGLTPPGFLVRIFSTGLSGCPS